MRRVRGGGGAVGAVALVLLAALALAPGAAAKPQRGGAQPCAAARSATVALNPQVRVSVRSRRGDADQHLLVGCLLRSGRTLPLDEWFSCGCSRGDDLPPQVWVRGTVVAVNRFSCDPSDPTAGCVGSLRSVDLRSRRTLHRASSGGSVGALVLGPRGAFAYVGAGGALAKADAAGAGVLDAAGIDAGSLAIAGARVYWMRAGIPHVALLAP